MALGFGKKNSEPEAKQSEPEAANAHSLYDSDTLSLDQFAAELEAVNPSAPNTAAPKSGAPAAGNSPLSWDEDSLLGDLNSGGLDLTFPAADSQPTIEFSAPAPAPPAAPAPAPRPSQSVGDAMFDDLEMELEGLPSFSTDFPEHVAVPVPIPERKTRKKPTSPDLMSADNMMGKGAPGPKLAAPKFSAPKLGKAKDSAPKVSSGGGKKKLGLVLGAVGVLVVVGGAGGFLYFNHSQSDVDSLPLPAAPPHVVVQPTSLVPVSPGAVTPGAVAPGAVAPGAVAPGAVAPGAPKPAVTAAAMAGAAKPSATTDSAAMASAAMASATVGTQVPVGVVPPGGKPTPDQQKILNRDWQGGADAKHFAQKAEKAGNAAEAARSYATARTFWEAGLKIEPGNAGFQGALAKLPPA